jgi:hypothetical protein
MILCVRDPENSTKKLLKIINPFSKAAGYKINRQKSVTLYANNKKTEKEIREKNLIYNSLKNNKVP